MVTAGNSSNAILLLWPSMRMFQFGMGLLMQSHTGCSLPLHADFPDSRTLLRQTRARISLFSSLWAWKSGMRPSSADKGWLPKPSVLWHRAAQSEKSTVRAGDALMNQTALSQRKTASLQCRHRNCVFPLSLLQNHLSETNSVTCLLWCSFLFSQDTKIFTPWQSHLSFSSALQRQTRSTFATKCLYQWKRKKTSAVSCWSAESCVYSETCGKSPRRLKD